MQIYDRPVERPLRSYRLIGREIGFNQSCVPSELYVRPAELINSNTSGPGRLPRFDGAALIWPFVTLIWPVDNVTPDRPYFNGKSKNARGKGDAGG